MEKHILQSSPNEDIFENSVKLDGCELQQSNIMDDLNYQISDSIEDNENAINRKLKIIGSPFHIIEIQYSKNSSTISFQFHYKYFSNQYRLRSSIGFLLNLVPLINKMAGQQNS